MVQCVSKKERKLSIEPLQKLNAQHPTFNFQRVRDTIAGWQDRRPACPPFFLRLKQDSRNALSYLSVSSFISDSVSGNEAGGRRRVR